MSAKTYWLLWLKAAGVRAIKTFFQTIVGLIPAAATISDVNWKVILGTAALAGLMSVCTSLAGLPEVKDKLPTKEESKEKEPDIAKQGSYLDKEDK